MKPSRSNGYTGGNITGPGSWAGNTITRVIHIVSGINTAPFLLYRIEYDSRYNYKRELLWVETNPMSVTVYGLNEPSIRQVPSLRVHAVGAVGSSSPLISMTELKYYASVGHLKGS